MKFLGEKIENIFIFHFPFFSFSFFFFNLDELSPPFSEQHNREQILIGLEKFIQKEYDGMLYVKIDCFHYCSHLVWVSFICIKVFISSFICL